MLVFSCPQQVHIPFSKPIRTQRSTLVRGGVAGLKRVTQNHSAVTSSKQLKFAEDNERKSLLRQYKVQRLPIDPNDVVNPSVNRIEPANGTSAPPKMNKNLNATPVHGGDQYGATGSLRAINSDRPDAGIDPK